MTQPSPQLPDPDQSAALEERLASGSILTPRTWREPWKAPFLEVYARNFNKSVAARMVNTTYGNVKWAINHDPEFATAVQEALEVGQDLIRRIIHERATLGQPRRRTVTKRKRNPQGQVIEEEITEYEETVFDNVLLHRAAQAWVPEFADTGDVLPARGPVEIVVYRQPTRERTLELLRLERELAEGRRPAVLPVIDAIVVQAPEEDEELA